MTTTNSPRPRFWPLRQPTKSPSCADSPSPVSTSRGRGSLSQISNRHRETDPTTRVTTYDAFEDNVVQGELPKQHHRQSQEPESIGEQEGAAASKPSLMPHPYTAAAVNEAP
ncbi:hypothetical protein CkaCkLH20_12239 [Colletotrichum karsti]|uniref:Uncharacterized protein n=1 Tax=Colletotrichum karsti TaxID=1095194 RepID=A0A9P6HUI7_9PEZI|nr:uncharacterized protein CkaCkLH20_12239 [Colletotrichum karsti]KAF9870275.1 hypothetical protein CkaCkLH20_12239 [Colletotrichum karsti]